jgi:hypothetical protein
MTVGQAAARAGSIARGRLHVEQFTELLAEGFTPGDAAERIGLKRKSSNNLMNKVRADLGWQAQ